MIRTTHTSDAAAICNIYNYYIENTTTTFEEVAISVDDMHTRITHSLDKYAHIVYLDNNEIVGLPMPPAGEHVKHIVLAQKQLFT